MSDFLIGTCHPGRQAYAAMRDVGLNAIRLDVPFPFADEQRNLSDAFRGTVEWVREMRREGITPLGITPYPVAIPHWNGEPGSEGYFALTRETARFLAEYLKDDIAVWESTNEMNVDAFRHPLDADQAIRFVKEGALGVKEGSADLQVGANMGGLGESARSMYRELYPSEVPWDYIGTDGYFGTWESGGPQSWNEAFDWLNELAPLPVYVMEWGFSSKGEIMSPEEVIPNATDPHAKRKWCFGWDSGDEVLPHTWEVQARFIEEAMPIICERAVGAFYYCWRDSTRCSCRSEDCPVEANWGLVDAEGNPKPSYYALQHAITDHLR